MSYHCSSCSLMEMVQRKISEMMMGCLRLQGPFNRNYSQFLPIVCSIVSILFSVESNEPFLLIRTASSLLSSINTNSILAQSNQLAVAVKTKESLETHYEPGTEKDYKKDERVERNIIATKGPLQQKYYKFKILMSLLYIQTNPKF